MNTVKLSVDVPVFVYEQVVQFIKCCPDVYDVDDAVIALLFAGLNYYVCDSE